jgi:hypothetical protein
MKFLAWLLGVAMVIAVVVFGLQIAASETGEVVVLHTDPDDADRATRLWVVDHDGHQWLRAGGGADSGWYERLQANPRVVLERDGTRGDYLARAEPARAETINELMRDKYGWRDQVVAVLAGARDGAVPVRLVPAEDSAAADR